MSADPEIRREEPKKRGGKSQYAEEMFERVRSRVAEGMPVPTTIQAAGMCVSPFYAAVAGHPEWKVALQKARLERRVGRLEDESCRSTLRSTATEDGRVFIGDSRLIFWKGEQVGEIGEPSVGMLIFMLKTLAPKRYANTKAAAKRRAQLDGLEVSRARLLVNAQRGVKIMQGHYREYRRRCGVPVPTGGGDTETGGRGDTETGQGKSDQSTVNRISRRRPPEVETTRLGKREILLLILILIIILFCPVLPPPVPRGAELRPAARLRPAPNPPPAWKIPERGSGMFSILILMNPVPSPVTQMNLAPCR